MKEIKKYDILIIFLCLMGMGVSFFLLTPGQKKGLLLIYSDGEKKVYPLEDRIINVQNRYGRLSLKVQDCKVKVITSDCPDKICVHRGWIKNPGDTIVCLPLRVMAVIEPAEREDRRSDAVTR